MEIKKRNSEFLVRLPTDSWYGSRKLKLLYRFCDFTFPKSWDLHIIEPDRADEMQTLSDMEISRGVQTAIGTRDLRKLAEDRNNAVIIVDDLSRPTPTYAVIPHVLQELEAGGIRPEKTTVIIGVGTHRPITRSEQRRKLGSSVLNRVHVVNHNCFTRQLKTFQRPNGGPDFKINRIVSDADLKISISGILMHGGAGFGGGAKAILPSVSSYKSIRYNHDTFDWEGPGIVHPDKIQSMGLRRDMEICARQVGLDYSINLVYSPYKDVLGVFAGDFIAAHRDGCKLAQKLFLTTLPAEKFDLIIANGYPMDTDIGQSLRGSWPEAHGKQSVLIAGARDGWAYHGNGGKSYRTYRQTLRKKKKVTAYEFRGTDQVVDGNTRAYFSPTIDEKTYYSRKADRQFFNNWEEVIRAFAGIELQKSVGIFPYASMQIENTPSLNQ